MAGRPDPRTHGAPLLGVMPLAGLLGPGAVAPLPTSDPQFWIVTAVAILAAGWIVLRLVPRRLLRGRRRRRGKHTALTIGGKPLPAERRGGDCH